MECWWYDDRKEGEERIAHVINNFDLYFEEFASYCGEKIYLSTLRGEREKTFGSLSEAVHEGNKICLECWKNIPHKDLMRLTHLSQ